MKGLLLKDFLCLKKQSVLLVACICVFAFISILNESAVTFISSYVTLMCVMMVITTFSYDELAKWDAFALSLPVSRTAIVLEKYIFSLIFWFAGTAASFSVPFFHGSYNLETVLILYATASAALLVMALLIPLIYKFGVQKSRISLILIIMIPIFLIMLGANFGGFQGIFIPDSVVFLAVWSSLPVSILLLLGSFLLSRKIYLRKEM